MPRFPIQRFLRVPRSLPPLSSSVFQKERLHSYYAGVRLDYGVSATAAVASSSWRSLIKMEDYLEIFLEEQKAKVAAEKALLEQDPPYMEIRAQTSGARDFSWKENIPPAQNPYVTQVKEAGLTLPLREQYERKKQRLQQELREDYRCYIAQVQDRLSPPGIAAETPDVLIGPPASREPIRATRDVATLTEAEPGLPRGHSRLMEADTWNGRLRGVVMDGDSELDGSGEEMDFPDQEQNNRRHRSSDWRQQRFRSRTNRVLREESGLELHRQHDDYRERRSLGLHQGSDDCREMKRIELFGGHKDCRVLKGQELCGGHDDYRETGLKFHGAYDDCQERRRLGLHQGNEDCKERRVLKLHRGCEDYRERRNHLKPSREYGHPSQFLGSRSRSTVDNIKTQFATGLMIGLAEAEEEKRRRKERYRQELQEQIAQQQRNRKREKDLELHVAATGANDPEKRPDRISQLSNRQRAAHQQPWFGLCNMAWRPPLRGLLLEEPKPPERPHVAFQSPLLGALAGMREGGTSRLREDSPRGLWNKLELSTPSVAPPPASSLSDSYRPLSDKVQDWYGGKRWLSPSWTCHEVLEFMLDPAAQEASPPGAQPAVTDWTGAAPSAGRNSQSNQAVLSYRDELKRQVQQPPKLSPATCPRPMSYSMSVPKPQIQDRQEQRRHEEEHRKRYEAKLEDEMKAYNPWGRSGAGAPLRDQLGNLITDLNQMHKSNEAAYLHPEWQQEPGGLRINPLRLSSKYTYAHCQSSADTPPSVPVCISMEPPIPQTLRQQDTYKECLRQQIEEKRRRQAEERERLRLVNEKDDERVAMERAKMLQEYEEEQEKRKQKETELKAKNEELFRQAEERRREEQRRQQQQEEEEQRRQQEEEQSKRESLSQPEEVFTEPPLPISAVQRRRGPQLMPQPPVADHRCSTFPHLDHPVPHPQSPPVPARRNQLRAEEERQVILNKLSALSKRLRAEQKHLEGQLLQANIEEQAPRIRLGRVEFRVCVCMCVCTILEKIVFFRSTEHPLLSTFDMDRLSLQGSGGRPFPKTTAPVSSQNNLKPCGQRGKYNCSKECATSQSPHDRDPSVSSLRRKQCTIGSHLQRRSNRSHVDPTLQSSLLESESTFIGPKGQTFCVPAKSRPIGRLSARERRRLTRTAATIDEVQPGASGSSTECCLRPNTSSSLKHLLMAQNPGQSVSSGPLMPTWEGPSTYHG
ncbi:centrosome and spindle pole associated protein 1-like isoform X2 [Arapaima gigas]